MSTEFKQTEAALERACVRIANSRGYHLLKIQGAAGWPDRLLLSPKGGSVFIEFKRRNSQFALRALQEEVHKKLRSMEQHVTWMNSTEQFQSLLNLLDLLPPPGPRIPIKTEASTGFVIQRQPYSSLQD